MRMAAYPAVWAVFVLEMRADINRATLWMATPKARNMMKRAPKSELVKILN